MRAHSRHQTCMGTKNKENSNFIVDHPTVVLVAAQAFENSAGVLTGVRSLDVTPLPPSSSSLFPPPRPPLRFLLLHPASVISLLSLSLSFSLSLPFPFCFPRRPVSPFLIHFPLSFPPPASRSAISSVPGACFPLWTLFPDRVSLSLSLSLPLPPSLLPPLPPSPPPAPQQKLGNIVGARSPADSLDHHFEVLDQLLGYGLWLRKCYALWLMECHVDGRAE